DHGHLLDADRTVFRNHADGDRWRRVEGAAAEGEIRLAGGRVLAPNNASEVILAWSERLRYASKKNGYHRRGEPQGGAGSRFRLCSGEYEDTTLDRGATGGTELVV